MVRKDLRSEALLWHVEHPELSVSVFACHFPGHYKDAAHALRVVRDLAADNEGTDMPLSLEEQLKLSRAEHSATRRNLMETVELLDYYRSQVNHKIDRCRPPAGYWIKGAVWGLLSDGDLMPKGKEGVYEEAVKACWAHYDKLHNNKFVKSPRPSTAHVPADEVRAAKESARVDLSDLLDDDEPEPEPVRRRRRITT
jgi:hypothetical protein